MQYPEVDPYLPLSPFPKRVANRGGVATPQNMGIGSWIWLPG
ncbi:Hypothetical protein Cul05146_0664 [Corynebacterium ulcerans]|nr:Hypothetical protein Cul05146_0664 [Corynebacterium ulcerans]